MMARLKYLLFIPLFFLARTAVQAQDNNYFLHKRAFYLCSYKKECSMCKSCAKDFYDVRIKNNADKKIKNVYYTYYSPLKRDNITREAEIAGDVIEAGQVGHLSVCMDGPYHWAITRITYADDSQVSFMVEGGLSKYHQEADECDCNIPGTVYPYGKEKERKPSPLY